jgi:hypothetical protein
VRLGCYLRRSDAIKALSGLEECSRAGVELEVGRIQWDRSQGGGLVTGTAAGGLGLHSVLQVEGILCTVRRGVLVGGQSQNAHRSQPRPRVVLKRWNVRVDVAWGTMLGMGRGPSTSTVVKVQAGALLLALDRCGSTNNIYPACVCNSDVSLSLPNPPSQGFLSIVVPRLLPYLTLLRW